MTDTRTLRDDGLRHRAVTFGNSSLHVVEAALEEQRNGQWRYGTKNGAARGWPRLPTVVRGHARVITFPQFTSVTRPACQPR